MAFTVERQAGGGRPGDCHGQGREVAVTLGVRVAPGVRVDPEEVAGGARPGLVSKSRL